MSDQKCPSDQELSGYIQGTLPEDAVGLIADHVEACPGCEATVENLEAGSGTVIKQLRQPAPHDEFAEEAECERAVQLIDQFGRELSQVDDSPGQTPAVAPAALGNIRVYELLSKIGEGGMGAVYKARHTELDKIVALKVLPADKLQSTDSVDRFKREMRAVGRLEHPNIVRAMDAGEEDGTHFLVMEYVKGSDLSKIVKQHGALPIADACEMIRQAAVGLDEAHEHQMVHRDIKPSNLMLAERRRNAPVVKILDMGLALLSEAHSPAGGGLTTTGQMMGTLDYMAPEQGGDSHDVDIRADVYALGASLYKLLTGEGVYHGPRYQTAVQKLMALASEPAPPIQTRRGDIPADLAAVVHQMLEKQPANRMATPADVITALAPFCAGADLSVYTTTGPVTGSDAASRVSTTSEQGSLDSQVAVAPAVLRAERSRTATGEKTAAAKVAPSSQRTPPRWRTPAAIAAALGGVALLAAVVLFTFKTPQGVITVEVDEKYKDKISISVDGGNGPLVISQKNAFSIKLADGKYSLELGEGDQQFQLSRREVTVRDGATQVVKVTLRDAVAANNTPDSTPKDTPDGSPVASSPPVKLPSGPGAPSLAEINDAYEAGYRTMEIGAWDTVVGSARQDFNGIGDFTQDSNHLVVCDGQGKARVINFLTQEVLHTIEGIQPPFAFSNSGTQMAAIVDEQTVGVWDWQTGKRVKTYPISSRDVQLLAFRDDGEVLLVRLQPKDKKVIELVSSKNLNPRQFVGHQSDVRNIAISPGHDFLVSYAGSLREVKTWRISDQSVLYQGKWEFEKRYFDVYLAFASDGKSFFITENRRGLARLDTLTGKTLFERKEGHTGHYLGSRGLSISRNGRLGYTFYDAAYLFDPDNGKVRQIQRGILGEHYTRPLISPDGQYLAIHDVNSREQSIRVHRLPTCNRPTPLTPSTEAGQDLFARFGDDIGCVQVTFATPSRLTADERYYAGRYHDSSGTQWAIIDASSGRTVRRFIGKWTIQLAPDGKMMAQPRQDAYGDKLKIRIMNVQTAKECYVTDCRWDHATFLDQGRLLLAVRDDQEQIQLFNTATGHTAGALLLDRSTHGDITSIAISEDGLQVAGSTNRGIVLLWEIPSELAAAPSNAAIRSIKPIRTLRAHQERASGVAFTHAAERLISCGTDNRVVEWEVKTGRLLRQIDDLAVTPNSVTVDRHDRVITGDIDGELRIHDWDSGKVAFTLAGHSQPVDKLFLAQDDAFAVSTSFADHTTRYWRLPPAGKQPGEVVRQGTIKQVAWRQSDQEKLRIAEILPLAEQVVTVYQPTGKEKTSLVRIWDVNAEQELRQLQGHQGDITQLAISPNERMIAGSTDKQVFVWAVSDGRLVRTIDGGGKLLFSEDSTQLLTGGSESPFTIWDLTSGKQVRQVAPVAKGEKLESFHRVPGTGKVVSRFVGKNGFLIWDWETGEEKGTFQTHHDLAMCDCSAGGDRFLIYTLSALRIVDATSLLPTHSLLHVHGSGADAQFIVNDRFLLTSRLLGRIQIWDLTNGEEIYFDWDQFDWKPFDVDMTADNEHLISVGIDGRIRKIRLPSEVIKRFKAAS